MELDKDYDLLATIPAQPGYFLFWCDADDDRESIEPQSMSPILAWGIIQSSDSIWAQPITADADDSPHNAYIMRPDGVIERQHYRSFSDFAELKEYLSREKVNLEMERNSADQTQRTDFSS